MSEDYIRMTKEEEILDQIEEYKQNKIFTQRELGIAIYMKLLIWVEYGIMDPALAAKLMKKVIAEFNLNLDDLEEVFY